MKEKAQEPKEYSEKIDEKTVFCPNSKVSQNIMRRWGTKKRQRYAHLVKREMYTRNKAFEIVEYHRGVI